MCLLFVYFVFLLCGNAAVCPWFRLVVVRRLSQELQKLLADRDLRQRFLDEAAVPSPGSPESFAELIARDLATWRRVAAEGGIRPE